MRASWMLNEMKCLSRCSEFYCLILNLISFSENILSELLVAVQRKWYNLSTLTDRGEQFQTSHFRAEVDESPNPEH